MAKPFHLKNGTILLSTEAPGGLYNANQLKKIAAISDANMAIVKATEDQRLALFVKEADAGTIAAELKSMGLGIRHYQDGLHQPTACIGELCPDHEQDALGAAMNLTKELADIKLTTPLKIGLNGCASCCVPCHTLDIAIVGDTSGYRISLGGKNSQLPELASFMAERVPPAELSKLVKKIVTLYQENTQGEESLLDVMERMGSSLFIAALSPYSQDAAEMESDPFTNADGIDDLTGDTPTFDEASDEGLDENLGRALDDGLEDSLGDMLAGDDENLIMAADLEGDVGLLDEDTPNIDEGFSVLDDVDDTTDLALSETVSDDLELLAQDGGETLLKNDLAIGGADEFGELEDDISAASGSGADELLAEEILFSEDDLLMEDSGVLVPEATGIETLEEAPSAEVPLEDEEPLVEEAGYDFEAQLEESIAEEENIRAMSEPDDLLAARDEALDILEEQINQERVADQDAPLAERPSAPMRSTSPMRRPARARSELCGLSLDEAGRLVLEFDSGATLALDASRLEDSVKTLNIGGQTIQISASREGYHVEADGLTFFQPIDDGLAAA